MEWGEINNVREWGRFKVHHKADRNGFLSALTEMDFCQAVSAFSGTLRTSCVQK